MRPVTQPVQPDDATLVAAYRAGDELAATALVGRHARALARFLDGAGAHRSEVEDLVQEAFFRAFRRLDAWRGEASFRSWLLAIGVNLMRDEFRRRKGRQLLSLEDRDVPDARDPAGDVTAAETEGRIRLGLERLPRLQREVFLLRVQQGLDYGSIASALGTTAGAARVHYHHAVKRLKELIE
jgi:RNA polymerase sigma-70 factor, ECF subfamily